MQQRAYKPYDADGETGVIDFAGVAPPFILKLTESLLSKTGPDRKGQMVFGGVHLSIFIDTHWDGHERYMLIGQDWQLGYNLRLPDRETDTENIFQMFATDMEIFTPSLTNERAFLRDACVLMMTASDWSDEETAMVW